MSPETHFRLPYLRPSWQGGDTAHPLCRAPRVGWAGPYHAVWTMTEEPEQVTCDKCLVLLWRVDARAA